MKKEDLRAGYVVEMRRGQKFLCISYMHGLTLNSENGAYLSLSRYDDELKHCEDDEYDIIRIYGLCETEGGSIRVSEKVRQLLWDREEEEKKLEELTERKKAPDIFINAFAAAVHENAVNHGWWETERSFPETIALCHSELSEALECYRKKMPFIYYNDDTADTDGGIETDLSRWGGQEPKGIVIEMIDCILRILDWCAALNFDVEKLLEMKNDYNKTRPYKHGGKLI